MPIYDYQCDDCGKTYDVLHKVREVVEDVICPQCGSDRHKRLISATNISKGNQPDNAPCGDSSRCGGSCRLN